MVSTRQKKAQEKAERKAQDEQVNKLLEAEKIRTKNIAKIHELQGKLIRKIRKNNPSWKVILQKLEFDYIQSYYNNLQSQPDQLKAIDDLTNMWTAYKKKYTISETGGSKVKPYYSSPIGVISHTKCPLCGTRMVRESEGEVVCPKCNTTQTILAKQEQSKTSTSEVDKLKYLINHPSKEAKDFLERYGEKIPKTGEMGMITSQIKSKGARQTIPEEEMIEEEEDEE